MLYPHSYTLPLICMLHHSFIHSTAHSYNPPPIRTLCRAFVCSLLLLHSFLHPTIASCLCASSLVHVPCSSLTFVSMSACSAAICIRGRFIHTRALPYVWRNSCGLSLPRDVITSKQALGFHCRTDKSWHTHTEMRCNTQEDERHSDPIFNIFDANLWVYFQKPREGVSLFIHVTLTSPDIP